VRLFQLAYACRLYGEFTDFDATYERFLSVTHPSFDVLNASHRKALFKWLNAWGCRQFAVDYHGLASENLKS